MIRILSSLAAAVAISGAAALAQEKFAITVPPYLQNLTGTGVTILWETNAPGTGWVEIAPDDGRHFYNTEKEKHFDSRLGIKSVGTLHKVTVTGLEPGRSYVYRVISQQAETDSRTSKVMYGDYASTKVNKVKEPSFTTPSPDRKEFRFAVINDIHGDSALVYDLFKNCDLDKIDFVVGNGDLVTSLNNETILPQKFLRHAASIFGSSKPLVAARGNHETRGRCAQSFTDYFPSVNDGLPYYAFRYGDTFFIVADCGEDKPDSDIEYYGRAEFDKFREAEAKWLESVIESEEYRSARYHIAFLHIPPVGERMWHGQSEINRLFLPVFNRAGLDVMFCGHTHNYRYWKPDEYGNSFPVIVNDNETIAITEVTDKGISVEIIDREGKKVQILNFKQPR